MDYAITLLPGGKIIRLSTVHYWCTVSAAWWGARTDAQRTAYANGLTAKNAHGIAQTSVQCGARAWSFPMGAWLNG